ncbi:hypothetical protein [Xanthomonas oryzae]|uniref:hypothetical protein n=1 Tax=Xanthomonas oryzae TaxID=347 RepID=UPI001F4CA8CA|nr:hypothetical protein [Xanthomonas oryzae]UNE62683.1 hypothetical protein MML47_21625 [Xanthomonas oryzae]
MMRNVFLIGLTMQLSGCIIGNGTICGPQTPMAMCDKKAYKALYHPAPLRDEWRKDGKSADQLNEDWLGCGGLNNGSYNNSIALSRLSGEKTMDYAARYAAKAKEKFNEGQLCMLNKGYIYTGRCDTDVTKVSPGCQARSDSAGYGKSR